VGGPPKASLDGGKTIANFWPAATTLFDFIRRAMPYNAPRSLSDHEVYALTAYLLSANKLIGENAGSCARAMTGHIAVTPLRSVMNSRRLIMSNSLPLRRGD
jgi:hypothetical protein